MINYFQNMKYIKNCKTIIAGKVKRGIAKIPPLSFENGKIPPLDFSPKVRQKGP